jgi:hypothetical protein
MSETATDTVAGLIRRRFRSNSDRGWTRREGGSHAKQSSPSTRLEIGLDGAAIDGTTDAVRRNPVTRLLPPLRTLVSFAPNGSSATTWSCSDTDRPKRSIHMYGSAVTAAIRPYHIDPITVRRARTRDAVIALLPKFRCGRRTARQDYDDGVGLSSGA